MTSSEVAAAIATLPRREAIAFVLHDVVGLTYADVGAVFEVTGNQAWNLRDAAVQRLRRRLREERGRE